MDATAIAAWWGAAVATSVLLWDIYKWKSDGPRLSMRISPNMVVIGDPEREGKTWVSVVISNTGSRPTTLKGLGMYHYKSLADQIRRKTTMAAVFPNPSTNFPLPRVLDPGDEWTGLLPQERIDKNVSLKDMAVNGHLIIWASQSHTSREKKSRLIFKPEEDESET